MAGHRQSSRALTVRVYGDEYARLQEEQASLGFRSFHRLHRHKLGLDSEYDGATTPELDDLGGEKVYPLLIEFNQELRRINDKVAAIAQQLGVPRNRGRPAHSKPADPEAGAPEGFET